MTLAKLHPERTCPHCETVLKICSACGTEKPAIAFGVEHNKTRGLLQSRCYACRNVRRRITGPPKPRGPSSVPLEKRFWAKVDVRGADECWLWRGASGTKYGAIKVPGRRSSSPPSRVSWELHNGREAPRGMFVCHRCDTPRCVNPAHLFLGSAKENSEDMVRKGRVSRKGAPRRLPVGIAALAVDARKLGVSYRRFAKDNGVCYATLWKDIQKFLRGT